MPVATRFAAGARPPRALLSLTLLSILLPGVAARIELVRAEDWGAWLGPRGDGTSSETGWLRDWPAAGPPRLFEAAIGEGFSAISVVDGRLLLFHREGDVLLLDCLDARSGKRLWRRERATDYVDRYGYNGGPRAQPVVAAVPGGRRLVFALSPEGALAAHDLADGAEAWSRDLEKEEGLERFFFGAGPSPLVDGGSVYLNLGGAEVGSGMAFALEAATGKVLWKRRTGGGSYATARLAEADGLRHLLVFHRTGLSSLDPATGDERWQFPWMSRLFESVNAATPLVRGDLVFISATYNTGGALLRLGKDAPEVLWKDEAARREKALDAHWTTPLLLGDHLYGFAGRHESGADLRCVELRTGKVKWTWPDFLARGSMIHAGGLGIALGERGDLALLKVDPDGHEVLRRVPRLLSYPAWTPPTLSGGVLYLRDERKLVALDLRLPAASEKKD